jgi:lipoprotein-anchoring transpeptidase ErfK/SrfK
VTLAAVLTATACGDGTQRVAPGGGRREPPSTTTTVGYESGRFIVEAVVPTLAVYDAPDAPVPSRQFENPWYYDAERRYPVPAVFYSDLRGHDWLRVLLPLRPNGSTGWVKASDVRVQDSRFRIAVDLSEHALVVYDGDQVLLEDTVAVGKPATPTPVGQFFLRVLIEAPDPNTIYGPYAYGLSSHSETLETFNGDDAEIGIHGNNDASVLGSDVTSGCVRMSNEKITLLAGILPLGTPVDVQP